MMKARKVLEIAVNFLDVSFVCSTLYSHITNKCSYLQKIASHSITQKILFSVENVVKQLAFVFEWSDNVGKTYI